LKRSLEDLILPPGVVLLQYVDDLLLCCPDEKICMQATITLLTYLAERGHKVNPSKVAINQTKVTFLGHVLTPNGKSLSDSRVTAIQNIPKPITKKQMMSFLGMTSYCRTFIPSYSEKEGPLSALIYGQDMAAHDKLTWTVETEHAFCEMKQALLSAPTLGIPNPDKPFTQTVAEKNGYMSSVLLQEHGGKLRPVAYFSTKLDAVARGLPACLRAVAAAERAVVASREFVGYSDLTLLVPHAVNDIIRTEDFSFICSTVAEI